jgi:hypothetical protein
VKDLLTRIPVIVLEAYPTPPPLTRNLFLLPNVAVHQPLAVASARL